MERTSSSVADFTTEVGRLFVPRMGTERVAPLLYELVRMVRPRTVLEIGSGYTTPFLARALEQVRADSERERERLVAAHSAAAPEDELVLLRREYYERSYEPHLVVVDDFSIEDSSASSVRVVLDSLHFSIDVTHINASAKDAKERLPSHAVPFDLVWVDAWECMYVFENYWPLIAVNGVLAMHYLVGYPEGEAVIEYIKATQQLHPDRMECLSLVEPHKAAQHSITLVRRLA